MKRKGLSLGKPDLCSNGVGERARACTVPFPLTLSPNLEFASVLFQIHSGSRYGFEPIYPPNGKGVHWTGGLWVLNQNTSWVNGAAFKHPESRVMLRSLYKRMRDICAEQEAGAHIGSELLVTGHAACRYHRSRRRLT